MAADSTTKTKYDVYKYYTGCIHMEIEASSSEEAESIADTTICQLSDEEFLAKLDPQPNGCDVR